MSYYASGGGEMILNKKGRKNLDAVQNVLDNTADEAFNYTKIDNNGQSLYVCRDFENYHEEKVFAFLQEINPYIKNGESIEYRGEDGQTWRFIKHNGNFFEQSGEIRYFKKHEFQRTKSEEKQ